MQRLRVRLGLETIRADPVTAVSSNNCDPLALIFASAKLRGGALDPLD
jgi:hypothetical protein